MSRLFANVPILTLLAAVLAASQTPACEDNCNGSSESFVVFAPAAQTSAIPLCTSAEQAQGGSITLDSGAALSPLPGIPVSKAALAQCAALCTAFVAAPCCRSVWEPDTVVCPPTCQNP